MITSQDEMNRWHMKAALQLAIGGLGRVWPNPSVGCVIAKDGIVLGRARTQDGGRPHAETQAIQLAQQQSDDLSAATAYVTLEPCAHYGQTPPCTQALIAAKIGRVVIATLDPDPRVAGQGAAQLRAAGIEVETGVFEKEARALNAGYFLRQEHHRPLITLKSATTLDGYIATSSGQSQWITGEAARRFGHIERSHHDAIIVGINTVESDNPSLTTRLDGVDHRSIRIVFDTHLKLKDTVKLFDTIDKNPVWVVTSLPESAAGHLTQKGVKIIQTRVDEAGRLDLVEAMGHLAHHGITRVLVEGGAGIVTDFVRNNLWDRFLWFRSASIMGAQSKPSLESLNITSLNETIKFDHIDRRILDKDTLDIYHKGC